MDGTQQRMKLDPSFHFPHKPAEKKEWHWSVYAAAVVPVAIAVAIPIVLWMLPSGVRAPEPPAVVEPEVKQGPGIIRFIRNIFPSQ